MCSPPSRAHLDLLTTPEELRATQFMCQVVQDVWYLGDMIPAQLALYEKLRQECGYDLSNALVVVVFATDLDSDILWAIAQPDFCEAPYGYLLADTTPVDQQADDDRIPPEFELCAPTARSLLRNHEADLVGGLAAHLPRASALRGGIRDDVV